MQKSHLRIVLFLGATLPIMFAFQNCNKTASFSLSEKALNDVNIGMDSHGTGGAEPEAPVLPTNSSTDNEESPEVIATDSSGDVVPVVCNMPPIRDQQASEDHITNNEPVQDDHQASADPVLPTDDVVQHAVDPLTDEDIDMILDSDCSDLAKKFKKAYDLSQMKDISKLSLLGGKVFVYSSTGNNALDHITIEKQAGRVVLCGLKVGKVTMKGGRLDLVRSEIKVLDKQHGAVKIDKISMVGKK